MPDRPIAGETPPAYTNQFPSGTIWMQIIQRAADATGKTVGVNLWVKDGPMADLVGYNLAGPGYDVQGGPFLATQRPTTWQIDPAGPILGKVLIADIVVPVEHFYHFEAHVGSVHVHCDCQLGKPGLAQMGPYFDSDVVAAKTPAGRMAEERRNVRDMMRPTPVIGRPNNRGVRAPRRVP